MFRLIVIMMLFFMNSSIMEAGKMINPLAELCVKLKDEGYPQNLTRYDNVYSPASNDYFQFTGDMDALPIDWIKCPSLVNMQNKLIDQNYKLEHQALGNGKELWRLNAEGIIFEDENVWAVVARYWLFKHV